MLHADSCQEGAGTALLILREAVGCSLCISPVVEEIIGSESHRFAADSRLPDFVPLVVGVLVDIDDINIVLVLPVVGIGGKPSASEGEVDLV